MLHVNKSQLSVDDVTLLVSFLLELIRYPVASNSGPRSKSVYDELEIQRLAFVTVGLVIKEAGPAIPDEALRTTIQVCVEMKHQMKSTP